MDSLTQLLDLVPESRRGPLAAQIDAVIADARGAIESSVERPDVEGMVRRASGPGGERVNG